MLRLDDELSKRNVGGKLAQIERALAANTVPKNQLDDLWRWLGEVMEQHDAHAGDPIGGWAMRLAEEVVMRLYDDGNG